MDKLKILVVEDESPAQAVMSAQLTGHTVDFAKDKKTAQKKLAGGSYDLCFLDLMLGLDDNYSGLKLIADAKSKGFYSVVMTSSDSDDIINKAYELGCDDFYIKGNEKTNICAVIAKYLQRGKSGNLNKIPWRHLLNSPDHNRQDNSQGRKQKIYSHQHQRDIQDHLEFPYERAAVREGGTGKFGGAVLK